MLWDLIYAMGEGLDYQGEELINDEDEMRGWWVRLWGRIFGPLSRSR